MLKSAADVLKGKQGAAMIISICLAALFTALGAAVMIASASYAAESGRHITKNQLYVSAKSMTAVIRRGLADPSNELGQRLFCEFRGDYSIDGYNGSAYVVSETGRDEDTYWTDGGERTVNVSVSSSDGTDLSGCGDIGITAQKITSDDSSVMYIYVTAERAGEKYTIKTCCQPNISDGGGAITYDGWSAVYTSIGGGNE